MIVIITWPPNWLRTLFNKRYSQFRSILSKSVKCVGKYTKSGLNVVGVLIYLSITVFAFIGTAQEIRWLHELSKEDIPVSWGMPSFLVLCCIILVILPFYAATRRD